MAKTKIFELLDKKTGFWLKDFCQKILPAKFGEGQKEDFGKKGMTLHVDVIFTKENDQLKKKVYFTAVYRCEQGLIDALYLADGNYGNYGNYYIEALYNLCKEKQLALLRYDYNESSCGKDQCDRESAGAKFVIRSFVDAVNDLMTAEDIYTALHHGKGIENADVVVVSIDSKASILSGQSPIQNISNYHSSQFFPDHMLMWRYFQVAKGKIGK